MMRVEDGRERLLEQDVPADPMALFATWLAEAQAAGLYEANAMTLATVGPDGRPAARIVLLKEANGRGFTFVTHYASRKGRALAANPWAALVFWWGPLEHQVRVEGEVERLTATESDAYYAARPKGARLAAWVSPQSQVIAGRDVLTQRLAELEAEYGMTDPPRPPEWGGYRLVPAVIEFWQSGPHRLHDRLRYTRQPAGGWQLERLAP
jgi:pyridoxamine 5'-phosphate oxidase